MQHTVMKKVKNEKRKMENKKYNFRLLENKVCVIVGAASLRSIGYATAELFAAHGAKLVLLDVVMNEDHSRIWAEESGKNFSLLRKMVLNLLKKEPTKKGIRRKQKIAGLRDDYLLKVLFTG